MHCYQHRIRRIQPSVLAVAGCIGSCIWIESCPADIDFDEVVEALAAGEVTRIADGDLEGDGDTDIVALIPDFNGKEGAIQAFINLGDDGDGNWNGFDVALPVRLGSGKPTAIAVDLINPEDQLLDVAVSIVDEDLSNGMVLIMAGDGVGGFVLFQEIQFPSDRPTAVKLAHFNTDRDDFLDLAVALDNDDAFEDVIMVFFGQKDGTFDDGNAEQAAAGGFHPIGIEPECLIGIPPGPGRDIAGVNQEGLGPGPGEVFVLSNPFDNPLTFEIGVGPTDLSVGDLNNDGFLDIVASNGGDGTFSLLLNDDGGTFGSQQEEVAGGNPVSIEAVDLDNDGDADVGVIADAIGGGPTVRVLENLFVAGDLPFGAPVDFNVDATPNTIISADINGDGRQDLITGNFDDGETSGSISVLINDNTSVLWDQGNYDPGAAAWVDQEFDDFPDFGSYLVTDIDTGGDEWEIESVTTFFTNGNDWANADITQGRLNIFAKTADLPGAGDDPGAGDIVDIVIIDLGDTIAITAADLGIELSAGEYWVGLTPLANFGRFGQDFHRGAPIIGVDTAWRNPGGGFGLGGEWSTTGVLGPDWIGAFDAAISITGKIGTGPGDCGPEDITEDGFVNGTDLVLLLGAWGPCNDCADCPADLDGDCDVDAVDLILLLGAWGPCQAHQAIYSNGVGPNYANGNEMAQWAQAEDFTGVDGIIEDVQYSVLDAQLQGLTQWDGTIQWAIYQGDPNANDVVGSGDGVNITTTFDQNANGFDFYFVEFDLDNSVTVSGANTYWLALHMGSDFVANSLFWATQDANGTATGLESNGSFDGPWNTNNLEHWFELGGQEDGP